MTGPAARVHELLRAAGWSLATAESLTGGRLAARLTDVPGSSATYVGGVVAYATELKISLLGVPADLVEAHGVVSAECAQAMAAGVRKVTGADMGVATTGVAGPDQQEGKPVGTVFVGIAWPSGVRSFRYRLDGDRTSIQEASCDAALDALAGALQEQTALG
ncbi:CinA family protein [Nocardioides sp.]|uniref:CinA family protein n=1 Tax=Nocardioides sp. TaxID=35761 RepID=UPI0039E22AD3